MCKGCGQRLGGRNRQTGGERETDGIETDTEKNWYEDNEAHATLGAEPNIPIPYALVLEHHHPIMSTLGGSRRPFR